MNGTVEQYVRLRPVMAALAAADRRDRRGAVLPRCWASPRCPAPRRPPAFSREGLPVEYLDVYSAAMGRNIRVQFQGRVRAAQQGGLSARRSARAGRLQRMGHQHPGVRVVPRLRRLGRDAGRRPVQLLHATGTHRRTSTTSPTPISGRHSSPASCRRSWPPTSRCRRPATVWSACRCPGGRR